MSGSLPEPFSVRPSGDFEGNDGSWSTFLLSVGNPDQNFRALVSTSSFSTWLPTSAGCVYQDDPSYVPSDCPNLRGVGLTNGFQSQGFDDTNGTFKYIGIHSLDIGNDLSITDTFGSQYNATANLGLDTLKLQNGAGSEELATDGEVPIFGLTTWNFFLPSVGLGAGFLQSTTQETPSLVESLANQTLIPSRSWSYTAGASYRDYSASLVLGGYDDTRLVGNSTTYYALSPSTQTSELLLSLASIAFEFANGTEYSAPVSKNVVVDSTLPYLYLPSAVCDDFASRLSLTYDEPTDLYTIDNSTLASNKASIEQIRITVGDTQNSGNTTSITFPYAAFDLNATWPFYDQGQSQAFFPIRRAPGNTYILGRTFLQEAHLSVDWERAYFNLSRAAFPSTRTEPNLIPIYNTTVTDAGVGTFATSSSSSSGLSRGAIVGIAVGSISGALLLLAMLLWCCFFRRRREDRNRRSETEPMIQRKVSSIIPPLSADPHSPTGTFSSHDPISPIDGSFLHIRRVSELGSETAHESRTGVNVMPGIHEVADSEIKPPPPVPVLLGDDLSPHPTHNSTPRSEMEGGSDIKPTSSGPSTHHSSPRSEMQG